MSKLGKALMALLLDKKARSARHRVRRAQATRPPHQPAPGTPPLTQAQIKAQLDAKLDQVHNRAAQSSSSTREQLLADAARVHAAKQDVLQDLSPEQKLKLQVLAMKAMAPKNTRN